MPLLFLRIEAGLSWLDFVSYFHGSWPRHPSGLVFYSQTFTCGPRLRTNSRSSSMSLLVI